MPIDKHFRESWPVAVVVLALEARGLDGASVAASIGDALSGPGPSQRSAATVFRDHIRCLECGRMARDLARHVSMAHGIAFAAYVGRWRLPLDYPRVCVDHAARRRRVACRAVQ